jgi:hypothetical protein
LIGNAPQKDALLLSGPKGKEFGGKLPATNQIKGLRNASPFYLGHGPSVAQAMAQLGRRLSSKFRLATFALLA